MKSGIARKHTSPKKLIAGADAVTEALENGISLNKIFVNKSLPAREIQKLKILSRKHKVPLSLVPFEKIRSFKIKDESGVIAVPSPVAFHRLDDVIHQVITSGDTPLFVLLDGITDVRNIGAIARTAYCTGVHALIIPMKGIGAFHDDAMSASAGALEKIHICRVDYAEQAVKELHLHGIKVVATDSHSPSSLLNADFTVPCAIVLGSEDKGIRDSIKKICDETVSIPMKNDFDSLNVSVAAGIILYEAMKQRL
ncbi:MAG: 23S rRNA (guanosine(2251)-2'-O)-methyltransferase RlmB [Chitinophagaceae bacterium]|nr:23S rRNA (guanosine(2251)-2'-O)-methyltransferase RlmB [Chitinophagaceae bacterium]